ncbi:MAG: MgtC/SapB family protein [Desulfurivibrionaceae bacterium]
MPVFDLYLPLFWQRIGIALVCGGIIGLERRLRGKSAGILTSILICLGTEVFVALGTLITADTVVHPLRVVLQVVTGIGLLGTGVNMAKESLVHGGTSAAVIWILAVIGSAIGLGYEYGGLILALVTVGVLVGVDLLEAGLRLRDGILPPHPPFRRNRKR